MARFPVSAEKERQLIARMAALDVREEDIEEQFVRSSGAGGQNVNKVSSCVLLHHRPSGIRVRCQKERSQGLNRFLARRILLEKIESLRRGAAVEAIDRRDETAIGYHDDLLAIDQRRGELPEFFGSAIRFLPR